jgi:hypothetical protein
MVGKATGNGQQEIGKEEELVSGGYCDDRNDS